MPTRTIYLPDDHDDAVTNATGDNGEYDNRSKAIQAAVATHFEVDE